MPRLSCDVQSSLASSWPVSASTVAFQRCALRGVVDDELPGLPQTVCGRLPAQTHRDRRGRDPRRRHDGCPCRAAFAADHLRIRRLGEVEPVRGCLDRLGRGKARAAGWCAERDEAAAGEDHTPVGSDVDGHVRAEDLQAFHALVEVDVSDAAVRAAVLARDGDVGDVGARDAELVGVLVEVAERDVERLGGACAGHPGHRARHECECQECGDENESPSRRRNRHCGFSPPWFRADQLALGELPQTAADDAISRARQHNSGT